MNGASNGGTSSSGAVDVASGRWIEKAKEEALLWLWRVLQVQSVKRSHHFGSRISMGTSYNPDVSTV